MTHLFSHPAPGGPVSAALEADVREQVWRHGVVVWLDQIGNPDRVVHRVAALADGLPVAERFDAPDEEADADTDVGDTDDGEEDDACAAASPMNDAVTLRGPTDHAEGSNDDGTTTRSENPELPCLS